MIKEYSLTFFAVLVFTVIIIFGYNGTAKQQDVIEDMIEIPLPLNDTSEQILYRKSYTVSYNKDNKIPNWVAWHLTAEHTSGPYRRPGGAWHEDEEVSLPRATIFDYRDCGWTRGHMCPAGDNKWDQDAMYDTFLLTNCCPQDGNLNSGDWNQIEMACRRWAEKWGDIYIVCGPIVNKKKGKRIGKEHEVIVPEQFFKVILITSTTPARAIGYIFENNGSDRPYKSYTIDEIEKKTGMDFFPNLPDNVENIVESRYEANDWKWYN